MTAQQERWQRLWATPPADIAIAISPADARSRSAREVGEHISAQLDLGRSLYRIVHDAYIVTRIGGFDGRALATPTPITEASA